LNEDILTELGEKEFIDTLKEEAIHALRDLKGRSFDEK
jgi:hypothetical protein